MIAVDQPRADPVNKTSLPLTRLAKLWASGTGIALLLVAPAYRVAQGLADPLVMAGAGEVALGNVIGFTTFGATVGAALAVAIGHFSRKSPADVSRRVLIALAGYAAVPRSG